MHTFYIIKYSQSMIFNAVLYFMIFQKFVFNPSYIGHSECLGFLSVSDFSQ